MSAKEAVEAFRVEAADLLEQVEQGLLDLLQHLDDRSLIDSVFRGLHTLKGSGAMFGFDALAAFTHHCETAFDRVRKGEAAASQALVSAVLAAKDHMRLLIEDPDGGHEAQGRALLATLEAAVAGAPAAVSAVSAKASAGYVVRFSLPADTLATGTNPLGLIDELRELGPCRIEASSEAVPALDELDPTRCYLSWTATIETDRPASAIEDVFIFVMDEMKLEITPMEAAAEATTVEPATAEEPAQSKPDSAEVARHRPPETRAAENVRVPAARLDELMDRVGELVIAQSRLGQLAGAAGDIQLRSVAEEIERLAGELRDTTMILRMVPVGSLFGRFRRLAHDLAAETGKRIELTTEGESTEVDKTVVERLADPLIHLIRNSADHGLETPEERAALGKPETGRISLAARQAGGEVIITITDDGRGINRERVRAKAEANGLIAPDAQLSDQELLQLIFHPGFSTAQAITNLSGRGVGMDVVKKTVEQLRGAIDVTSRPGEGATVALRIPLTLAIIDGLLVRVGASRYVIPLGSVEECLELSPEEDLRSQGRRFISLRDKLVPYLRLRELLGAETAADPHQKLVVVSTGAERIGVVVDQIVGQHQTVIKPMSKLHDELMFSGATILGDGGVALILDIARLVAAGQEQEAQMRIAG